jgi:hypothetical protein
MKKDGNKRLVRNAKSQQLFTKKDLFSFSIFLRFYVAIINKFHSTTSYLRSKCTAKTYETKDFFLANDVETNSSNKEENEKRFFLFYLSANKETKRKHQQSQNQEKQILA